MSKMKLSEWTAQDSIDLIDSLSQWDVGDYIQPLVGMADGYGRRTLRVTKRIQEDRGPILGMFVAYLAVDRFGTVFDIMRMDDPRRGYEEEFNAEEPGGPEESP